MGGDFFKIAQRYVLFELWSFPSAYFIRFSGVIFLIKSCLSQNKSTSLGHYQDEAKTKFK